MNIIPSFIFFILGLILYVSQVFTKVQLVYEINVIPIDNTIFEAGIKNQIRIALWSKTRNYPIPLEEMEEIDNSLVEISVFSKDLRSYNHFTMEDFPHYNNETHLPRTANYFDIDYVFPIAGDYTIFVKCKPYKKTVRVSQDIHVEGKKEYRMDLDSALMPIDPDKPKVIYFRPVQIDDENSIYRLPIILHKLLVQEKNLKEEVEKDAGPIYGTKISVKNTLRSGFCSNVILEFFRVELKDNEIKETPINDLFPYNDVPIKAIMANEEKIQFDAVQGNIIKNPSDRFPSCGSDVKAPKESKYGPNFGFSLPFRSVGLYRVIFEIAHSFDGNTYLLSPSVFLRITENGDEKVNFEPEDYFDDDKNYDQFIKDVLDKKIVAPTVEEVDDDSYKTDDSDKSDDKTDSDKNESDKSDDKTDSDKNDSDKSDDKNDSDKNDSDKSDDKNDSGKNDSDKSDDKNNSDKNDSDKSDKNESDKTDSDKSDKTESDKNGSDKSDSDKTDSNKPNTTTLKESPTISDSIVATTPVDEYDDIPESAHGKIILIGVVGIVTLSGLMFYKQKSGFADPEVIPLEYKQIVHDDEDEDDEDFMLNDEEKDMLDRKSNISLDIESEDLLDTEDYTLLDDN